MSIMLQGEESEGVFHGEFSAGGYFLLGGISEGIFHVGIFQGGFSKGIHLTQLK